MKSLRWLATSLNDVRGFPESVRIETGRELMRLQLGLDPSNWKPMTSVGAGVREIRIKQDNIYRVFYITSFGEAIYVIHAFKKKTQKTAPKDIELATSRLKTLIWERKNL